MSFRNVALLSQWQNIIVGQTSFATKKTLELIVSRCSQRGGTFADTLCRNKCTQWARWSINLFFSIIAAQALKEDFPLSHVISPFTNQERREGMLLNLLIPFVLTVGSGSKGLINLTKGNVPLLLCFLTTRVWFLVFLST